MAKWLFGYNLFVFLLLTLFTRNLDQSLEAVAVSYLWCNVGFLASYFLVFKPKEKEFMKDLKKLRDDLRDIRKRLRVLFA